MKGGDEWVGRGVLVPQGFLSLEDLGWRVLAMRECEYAGTCSSSAGPTGPTTSLQAVLTAPALSRVFSQAPGWGGRLRCLGRPLLPDVGCAIHQINGRTQVSLSWTEPARRRGRGGGAGPRGDPGGGAARPPGGCRPGIEPSPL